jgi:hypothetical protein
MIRLRTCSTSRATGGSSGLGNRPSKAVGLILRSHAGWRRSGGPAADLLNDAHSARRVHIPDMPALVRKIRAPARNVLGGRARGTGSAPGWEQLDSNSSPGRDKPGADPRIHHSNSFPRHMGRWSNTRDRLIRRNQPGCRPVPKLPNIATYFPPYSVTGLVASAFREGGIISDRPPSGPRRECPGHPAGLRLCRPT